MAHSFARRITGTTPYYNLIRRVGFPSTRAIAISSVLVTTIGISFSFFISEQAIAAFAYGAMFGMGILAVPSFASATIFYLTVMKDDPLFYLRRCLAFSLFTVTMWVLVFLFSSVAGLILTRFIFPDFAIIVGLFTIIPMRAVAVFSMSRVTLLKRVLFTLGEPTLIAFASVLGFGISVGRIVTALTVASVVGLAFAFTFVIAVERRGRKAIGFSPLRMFRAFLADWLEGENHELESYLKNLGVEAEIDVAAFAFRAKGARNIKGVMLVSNFHAGPFLNIGSSVLPFLFQSVVSRRFNAVALVPHGVSGHELNLVSQEENARVIRWVLASLENAHFLGEATHVTRANNRIATATSQVFDGCALVTMTTSPYDMEDIPSDVASRLAGLTQGKFRHVAAIDAHNCLTGPTTMTSDKLGALEEVALSSLQASAERDSGEFKVGLARRVPPAFTLKNGLGPGGISVLGIEVDGQRFAYISIDGNNMVRGLREEIIDAARSLGYDDGEVMTSDTHMVNGIVSARLGYYRVGEAVSKTSLLNEIRSACSEAMADMEPCEVAAVSGQIGVTTLGSESLKRVMSLVYRISKLTTVTILPVIFVLAVLSLLFLV